MMMEVALAMVSVCVGAWLGARIKSDQWARAADDEPRVHHAGKLYWVVRDDDLRKAERIVSYMGGATSMLRSRRPPPAASARKV